jgi:methanethiol S-methyltransferase
MKAFLAAAYSGLCYLLFLVVFACAVGWVENLSFLPKTIDSGEAGDLWTSLAVNAGLLGVFAVQHSVMARPAFKRWWTRLVPAEIERSTYVLFASLALALVLWQWRPLPAPVWSVSEPIWAGLLVGLSWTGWAIVLLSTFLISHFHLFGLSQGMARLMRLKQPAETFTTPLFYRWVRHPLYVGFIIAFWATPQMSIGHLFFACATTAYILIAIQFEERDLIAVFGERYRQYRRTVGMLAPRLRPRRDLASE